MKIRYKEIYLYACIMIFSALLLIHSFSSYFVLGFEGDEVAIPIANIVFMTIGLIYLGIAVMMSMGMWKYYIGKLFSIQLFLIGAALIVNFYVGDMTRLPMNILLIASNVCLYGVIGRITGLYQGQLFKTLMIIHIMISILQMLNSCVELIAGQFDRYILPGNYIITFFVVLILLAGNYRKVSKYSKNQIKVLMRSLTIGIILYCILSVVNTFELSSSDENTFIIQNEMTEEEDGSADLLVHGNDTSTNSSLPAIVFAIVTFRILYILIRKEYFASEIAFWINKVVKYIIVIVVINLIIAIYFTGSMIGVFISNAIFVGVLIFTSYEYLVGDKSQREIRILEEDRHTLAMYLHDEILQDVFAVKNTANIDRAVEEKLTTLVGKIRNLSNDLFPLIVENVGLNKSLEIYISDLRKEKIIEFDYEYNCEVGILELHLETTLYRNVKELVNNAIKHAEATKISIAISADKNGVLATVVDDGKGFEVPALSELIIRKSMGLYSIYKQSKDLGGEFKLYSSKNTGTECTIKLPL